MDRADGEPAHAVLHLPVHLEALFVGMAFEDGLGTVAGEEVGEVLLRPGVEGGEELAGDAAGRGVGKLDLGGFGRGLRLRFGLNLAPGASPGGRERGWCALKDDAEGGEDDDHGGRGGFFHERLHAHYNRSGGAAVAR